LRCSWLMASGPFRNTSKSTSSQYFQRRTRRPKDIAALLSPLTRSILNNLSICRAMGGVSTPTSLPVHMQTATTKLSLFPVRSVDRRLYDFPRLTHTRSSDMSKLARSCPSQGTCPKLGQLNGIARNRTMWPSSTGDKRLFTPSQPYPSP
jgi:hypothetical protein